MKSRIATFLLLALVFPALSGCGLVLKGGIYFLYTELATDRDEDLPPPGGSSPLPSVTVGQRVTTGALRTAVQFDYTLVDTDSLTADLAPAYSTDGGNSWNPITEVPGLPSEGTQNLAASPAGISHSFVWNVSANLPAATNWNTALSVRMLPIDDPTGTNGTPWVSAPFSVNVNTSPIVTAISPAGPFPLKVLIQHILIDGESDPVDVTVEFSTAGPGGPWSAASRYLAEGEGTSGLTASPTGIVHTFAWDSTNDLPGQANVSGVHVRISPFDGAAPAFSGTPWISGALDDVNYNSAPSILGSTINSVPLGTTTVAVNYSLIDAESDDGDITVEYQKNGSGPWLAAVEASAGSDGTNNLAAVPSPGSPHVFVWDFAAETAPDLTVVLRFSVADSVFGTAIFTPPPSPWVSNSFQVNMTGSVHNSVVTVQDLTADQCDAVALSYILTDDWNLTGHTLSIEVKYSLDGGSSWLPGSGSASEAVWDGRHEGLTGLFADPDGEAHVFVWDSFRDLGAQNLPRPPGGPGVLMRVISTEYGNFSSTPAFTLFNKYVATVAGTSTGTFGGPGGVALDGSGNPYICDLNGHRIFVLNAQSTPQTFANVSIPPLSLGVIAGTGNAGYNSDNIPAVNALLNEPSDLALDGASPPNLFITDSVNHRIRRVDGTTGYITTIAGTGSGGRGGDGGPATQAQLRRPFGLAFDSSWNLWITDRANHQIRYLNRSTTPVSVFGVTVPAGALQRISGDPNGAAGFSGDSRLFTRLTPPVAYDDPSGIAIDGAGNLYICDRDNNRVRVANATGSSITVGGTTITSWEIDTVVGTGTAGNAGDGGAPASALVRAPRVVALDSVGNLFFAGYGNDRVRAVDTGSGSLVVGAVSFAANTIDTVAGGGGAVPGDGIPALNAQLKNPCGLFLDGLSPQGFYIAENRSTRIRIVNTDPATTLTGVATDQGTTISVAAGNIDTTAGSDPAGALMDDPRGLAFTGSALLIADPVLHQVLSMNRTTRAVSVLAGDGTAGNGGDAGPATAAQLDSPHAVAVDGSGTLVLIADTGNGTIRAVNSGGTAVTAYGVTVNPSQIETVATGFLGPEGLFVDTQGWAGPANDIFVSDTGNHQVKLIARSDGSVTVLAGTGTAGAGGDGAPASAAQFNIPNGVCLDSGGTVYVADRNNHRVRAFTVGGNISTVVGTGTAGFNGDNLPQATVQLDRPVGVRIDGAGDLLVVEERNECIRRLSGGIVRIICGTAVTGFNGDGNPAVNTDLNFPFHCVVDAGGNVYFSDSGNKRVRRFRP